MSSRTIYSGATDSYFELVKRFPLRRIRTSAQREAAARVVREIATKGKAELDTGTIEYLEALAGFISDFEKSETRLPNVAPLDVLKHLMEERDMRPADLGKLIGSSAATMLLKGQRDFSKAQIRKLATFFSVSPAVFL